MDSIAVFLENQKEKLAKISFLTTIILSFYPPMLSSTTLTSPLGDLIALADEKYLYLFEFSDHRELDQRIATLEKTLETKKESGTNAILTQTKKELEEYFAGKRKTFTLPLAPYGTLFQMKAWKALEAIPYGETRSYLEEASMIGNPKAVRAIGGANHANPIPIIIPCHRVIGKSGKLVGYGGGLERKIWLLEHEKKYK